MVKQGNKSENRKRKYAAHPAIAATNKVRRMRKHLKKHPNDSQTRSKV